MIGNGLNTDQESCLVRYKHVVLSDTSVASENRKAVIADIWKKGTENIVFSKH